MERFRAIAVLCFCLVPGATAFAQDQDNDTSQPTGLADQFAHELFTPGNSAKLALGLLYDQTIVAVPEWGSGREGLAHRAEWLVVGYTTRLTTQFTTAKLLGRDTSYQRCACKGFPKRVTHALHSEFLERRYDGTPVFATARMTGIYVAAAVSESMLPQGRSAADFSNRAITTIGIDEGFNVLQEFWPEIKRTLLFRQRPSEK
jgi:hypothetical protein